MFPVRRLLFLGVLTFTADPPAFAQIESPAASVGRPLTVVATRVTEPPVLDGRLDERVYSDVVPIEGFLQQEPVEGAPGTEPTAVWVLFDRDNIYIAGRMIDSHPERMIANEMRRDGQGINDSEGFAVVLDTFHDQRNAFLFQTTLAGALYDGYITDERDINRDWNTIWDVRTARRADGWSVEMVIPVKSLRFRPGAEQIWGINFKRIIRWKNETQYLTRIPAALGRRGIVKMSSAATLVGIEVPTVGRNYEVKPYGIAGVTTLNPADGTRTDDGDWDKGVDVKVGLTDGLTADFTYNTDFAQVEEDEQQVNLTRFNTVFPEKRDFFLEGQGIFSFGGLQQQPRSGGQGASAQGNPNPIDVPVVFFSRRIGLSGNQPVPIDAGGRLTGKAGAYSIGVLDIRTADVERAGIEPANFGVVRIKRDILRRSAIGLLFTDRSHSSLGDGRSQAYGVDGVFSFYENLSVNTYVARTDNPGVSRNNTSYRAQVDYNADRYGLQVDRLALGERFNPDVGFLRRSAFTRNSGYARFSPRPRSVPAVRKLTWEGMFDYITDPGGRLESRLAQANFRTELENGDAFGAEVVRSFEQLARPFEISRQVVIPAGRYGFSEFHLLYNFGPQRQASANVAFERGSFYGGTRTSISMSRARIQATNRLVFEPGVSFDRVDLPAGSFSSKLITSRVSYPFSARMNASALLQYNSGQATLNTNIRLRWEYRPGSDFFLVYSDNRDTTPNGFPELRGRGLVVKLTRLLRF
jgi:hypothetical protein